MGAEDALWRWRLLYDALSVLSWEPSDQLRSLGGGTIDDVALDADSAIRLIPTLRTDGFEFPEQFNEICARIDSTLEHMSGGMNAAVWTEHALRTDEQWASLRWLAQRAIVQVPTQPTFQLGGSTGDIESTVSTIQLVLTNAVADEIALTYSDRALFPDEVDIDRLDEVGRAFPGWPGDVLRLATENQGVCEWGISVDPGERRVVVSGEFRFADRDNATLIYCLSIEDYIEARRWDAECFREPLLQAQADPLDRRSAAFLEQNYDERITTYGWPGAVNRRFEGAGLRILVWNSIDECNWWISGSESALRTALPALRRLSGLDRALWSNDNVGIRLLDETRDTA